MIPPTLLSEEIKKTICKVLGHIKHFGSTMGLYCLRCGELI